MLLKEGVAVVTEVATKVVGVAIRVVDVALRVVEEETHVVAEITKRGEFKSTTDRMKQHPHN